MRHPDKFSNISRVWADLRSQNYTPTYVNGLATYAWVDTGLTQPRSPAVPLPRFPNLAADGGAR